MDREEFDLDESDVPQITPLDIEASAFYLSDGGPLSTFSENFEMRPMQVDLLRDVVRTFNEEKVGVFEAGTGVGKSYAYLVPAILWAAANKERVVVSTGTINLQQQLLEKDIPTALKITGKKVKAVLLKGRQNYVCRRRLQGALLDRDLFNEDAETVSKINDWTSSSKSGSRSDLDFFVSESAWSRVKSESDACMGMRCPFFHECFVMKTRKDALDAGIIVVNHHLLFADIESRLEGAGYEDAAVLPPYRRLIFDEAHTIEGAATSFFSGSISRFQIIRSLNQLYRKRRGGSATGHLVLLAILAGDEETTDEAAPKIERIKNDIASLEKAAVDLIQGDYNFRISEKTGRAASPVVSLMSTLACDLSDFVSMGRDVLEKVSDEDKTVDAYWETRIALRRLESAVKMMKNFCKWQEHTDTVFWLQKKNLPSGNGNAVGENDYGTSDYIVFNATPLDISGKMNEGVFAPMSSTVCVSATLTINGTFNFWIDRAGLRFVEKERLVTGEFSSPFAYKKNMLFAVPNDAPPLPEKSLEFEQFAGMAVPRLIAASEGRTLVLFTSYDSLKNVFRASQAALQNQYNFSGNLLRQGDGDNARLLEAFRDDEASVLFATDSFWQGVDVPGKSLSQVIIVKLPFSVPSDPVFAARSEALERRGGNAFMQLSVPEAVMKFRQGVGRLIRRGDDRGIVVLLDRRVYEKRYGGIFLGSLPETKKFYEPLSKIASRVEEFLL